MKMKNDGYMSCFSAFFLTICENIFNGGVFYRPDCDRASFLRDFRDEKTTARAAHNFWPVARCMCRWRGQ